MSIPYHLTDKAQDMVWKAAERSQEAEENRHLLRPVLANVLADVTDAIRRHPYRVLQELDPDYEEGLNAKRIIDLADVSGAGQIISRDGNTLVFHRGPMRKPITLSLLGGSEVYKEHPWSEKTGEQIADLLDSHRKSLLLPAAEAVNDRPPPVTSPASRSDSDAKTDGQPWSGPQCRANSMAKSPDEGILQLFRRALADADSLVAMANHDSAQVGWRSADSACHHLSTLLQCVNTLLFDTNVEKHLELCPPPGCTPDGAELPGLPLTLPNHFSWHHLARDLAHAVAMTAAEYVDADARFLFDEQADEFEYVPRPHTDDDKVVYHDVRRFEPGEKRAGRLAEMLGNIRERGSACWPEMAGALHKTGLNSTHFQRTWDGVRREWREISRTAQTIADSQTPKSTADPLPATHRDHGRPDGKPLVPSYTRVEYGLSSSYISRHKKKLHDKRIKHGRQLACSYRDIAALALAKNDPPAPDQNTIKKEAAKIRSRKNGQK